MNTPTRVPEKWGERIKGSKLYRAFCHRCGEPKRVHEGDLYSKQDGKRVCAVHYCEECGPSKPSGPHTGTTYRQKMKLGKTTG